MPENIFGDLIQPLNREPISVTILNIITDSILSGKLKPGDKLPTENELAQTLGVGRNSVREAIKMLSSLGVIEIKRGAGTFISRSISSLMLNPLILSLAFEQGTSRELVELRLMLEIGAAELAIEKASDEEIKKLEEANNKLRDAAKKQIDDPKILRDLDLNVHFTLFDITKNTLVAKIAKAVYRLFFASIEKTVKVNPLDAYENHKMYIDAIKKRDKPLVRKEIHRALSYWIDFVSREEDKREKSKQ